MRSGFSRAARALTPDAGPVVVGVGRLGLCAALCLEKKGFQVLGVDIFQGYVDALNAKTFKSDEPHVTDMLQVH